MERARRGTDFFFFSRGETAAVARWRVSSDGALVFRSRERWRTAASMHASTNTAEDNTAGIGEGTGRGGEGVRRTERERKGPVLTRVSMVTF